MPKLAEALVEHESLQKRLKRYRARLTATARQQEGDIPDDPPGGSLAQTERTLATIKRLTSFTSVNLNRTSSHTPFPTGLGANGRKRQSIMDAIAEGNRLYAHKRIQVSDSLPGSTQIKLCQGRVAARQASQWRPSTKTTTLQIQIDTVAQECRMLDTQGIQPQKANWPTRLTESKSP